MAWIESHQALGHHPKTLRLAAALGCSVPTAVGHLQFLWWWALDYAPDGLVAADDTPAVAKACLWKGSVDRFWEGLRQAGFVEDTGLNHVLRIHDWMEYAGKYVDRRARNAERMRSARGAHVQDTCVARVQLPTGPTNQPNQPSSSSPTPPPSPDLLAEHERRLAQERAGRGNGLTTTTTTAF